MPPRFSMSFKYHFSGVCTSSEVSNEGLDCSIKEEHRYLIVVELMRCCGDRTLGSGLYQESAVVYQSPDWMEFSTAASTFCEVSCFAERQSILTANWGAFNTRRIDMVILSTISGKRVSWVVSPGLCKNVLEFVTLVNQYDVCWAISTSYASNGSSEPGSSFWTRNNTRVQKDMIGATNAQ